MKILKGGNSMRTALYTYFLVSQLLLVIQKNEHHYFLPTFLCKIFFYQFLTFFGVFFHFLPCFWSNLQKLDFKLFLAWPCGHLKFFFVKIEAFSGTIMAYRLDPCQHFFTIKVVTLWFDRKFDMWLYSKRNTE